MEKTEKYTMPKEEVLRFFSEKLGKQISRIRFSPRKQTFVVEIEKEITQ